MRWSEGETIKFVELYREHECLWNVTKPIYRNNQMRLAALQQIVDEMNMDDFSVADARAKIKNLRNTYNQELQKIEKSIKSGMGGDDAYTPSMKWFKVMDAFVRKTKEKRATQSNLDDQHQHYQEEKSNEDENGDEETTKKSQNEESVNDAQTNKKEKEATEPCTPQNIRQSTSRTSSLSGRKRRFQDLSAAVTELRQVTDSVITQTNEEDEFDTFCRYLAISLKKMPLHLALQCENELQATMNRYRIMAVTPVDVIAASPNSSSLGSNGVADGNYITTSDSNYSFEQPSAQTFSTNVVSPNENSRDQEDCLSRLVAETIADN